MAFFLGIDGGGTKTECVIGDETRVLGSSFGSTVKIKKVGTEAARKALTAAVRAVCREAGVEAHDIAHTCIGIAGSSIREVTDWTQKILGELVSGEVEVVNDALIAHQAAFHGEAGVLVIAGTGSHVLGMNERGEAERAGGWGPIISDEGSGFWIGRLAVAQAMRAYDCTHSVNLLDGIMEAWKLESVEEVVSTANSNPPPDFASLLPAILRCADSGDPLAREILAASATELANLARIVIRKLWPTPAKITIAVTGGVFAHSSHIGQMFANTIRAERPGVSVNLEPVHPVMGALSIARKKVAAVPAR